MLANLQISDIYGKWCSKATAEHVENKLGETFNQWVRVKADELDPSQADFFKNWEMLANLEISDIYGKWCSKATAEHVENKLRDMLDQWVRVKVDELDPSAPDFMDKLEILISVQETHHYTKWCPKDTHEYKEQRLQALLALTPEVPTVPEVPAVPEMPVPRGALTEPQCDLSDFFAWDTGEQVEGPPWANLRSVSLELVESEFWWDLILCGEIPVDAQLELEIAIDADGNPDTGATRPPEDEWPPYTAYNDIGVDYMIWGALHGIIVEGEGGVTIIEPKVERVGIDKFTGEEDPPWEPIETEIVELELVSVEPITVRFSFPAEEWDVMVGLTPPAEEVKLPEAFDFVAYTVFVDPYGQWVVDVIPDEGHGTWQRD